MSNPKRHATDRLDAACRANDSKKRGPRPEVKEIAKAERLLRDGIRRAGLPPSLSRQAARMVGYFAHKRLRGCHAVWPGMEKMAKWGGCGERMARKNFAQLEAGKVIHRVGAEKGGWRLATEWIVDPKALKRWLILIGANPSPKLFDTLDTVLFSGAPYPEAQSENPEPKPGTGDAENVAPAGSKIDLKTRNQNPEQSPELSSARREEKGYRRAVVASGAPAQRQGGHSCAPPFPLRFPHL